MFIGFASFINRPYILGTFVSDLLIRLFITFWFCGLYIRLSRFSSYSGYRNKKWTKADVKGLEKYFLTVMILFSVLLVEL
jgi:hypothetical protein